MSDLERPQLQGDQEAKTSGMHVLEMTDLKNPRLEVSPTSPGVDPGQSNLLLSPTRLVVG